MERNENDALKSLQERLHEIRRLNPTSFQYQTAIQQITGQEQGEADAMLSKLSGCYFKERYYVTWNVMPFIFLLLALVLLAAGAFIVIEDY